MSPQGNLPCHYYVRDLRIDPCVVLAPMEGVTNLTFRRLIRSIGGVGLSCTEFIPGIALSCQSKKFMRMAEFDPDERPVSIQIYGKDPEEMAEGAQVVQDLGASIIDINMGCPSKKVCHSSGGSALMKEPELAVSILRAVRKAVSIPMTVKMRSGFDAGHRNAPELAWVCQEEGAEAIAVHWRTREDRFGGSRAVDKIAETVHRLSIPVIANGDIIDIPSAVEMFEETGCAGVMIGRGAMRNPWLLRQISDYLKGNEPVKVDAAERKRILLEFLSRYAQDYRYELSAMGKFKQISKHFCQDMPNGQLFRSRLLRSQSIEEILEHVQEYFSIQPDWVEQALPSQLHRPSS